ncbi:U-scoloptoxin(19)-Sm1a [Galleria mellonella]|uniref:U-scoloptoxin(19)-Sm1a n=1 Tax=Galleria mellonella TaxID=7137 RepID=A0A6J1X947_GALME|nr:U-scoloptoxin(19)-Sm1a [Galleria mellonella]
MRLILFWTAVAVSAVTAHGDVPEGIYNELPCLAYGGECSTKAECPDGKLSKISGLCPTQQDQGVECCYRSPSSTTRCKRRGGECISKDSQCPEYLLLSEATDCSDNEKCCIFVK